MKIQICIQLTFSGYFCTLMLIMATGLHGSLIVISHRYCLDLLDHTFFSTAAASFVIIFHVTLEFSGSAPQVWLMRASCYLDRPGEQSLLQKLLTSRFLFLLFDTSVHNPNSAHGKTQHKDFTGLVDFILVDEISKKKNYQKIKVRGKKPKAVV